MRHAPCAIKCNQVQSGAIKCNQMQSRHLLIGGALHASAGLAQAGEAAHAEAAGHAAARAVAAVGILVDLLVRLEREHLIEGSRRSVEGRGQGRWEAVDKTGGRPVEAQWEAVDKASGRSMDGPRKGKRKATEGDGRRRKATEGDGRRRKVPCVRLERLTPVRACRGGAWAEGTPSGSRGATSSFEASARARGRSRRRRRG